MKISLIGILVLLFSFGCSKTKDLADAGKTTKEMSNKLDTTNDTTLQMSETTDELKLMTGDLKGITTNMYVQLRLKEAEESRDRRTKNLFAAESFHQKVTEAAAYFKAFEYQYWTANEAAGDDQHVRDEKMMAAAQEFFRFLTELVTIVGIDNVSDYSANMQDKTNMSLNAISVALHQIDDYQKVLIEQKGIKKIHMLNMIKDTLVKLGPLEAGEITLSDLKDYEKEILENSDLAVMILKVRLNTFGIMALTKISNVAEKNGLQKLNMIRTGWTSKFDRLNPALQHKVIRYLREANKTKAFLVALGVKASKTVDQSLNALYSAMREKEADRCDGCNREKAAHLEELNSLVNDFTAVE